MPSTRFIKNGMNERNLRTKRQKRGPQGRQGAKRKGCTQKAVGRQPTNAVCSIVFLKTNFVGLVLEFP